MNPVPNHTWKFCFNPVLTISVVSARSQQLDIQSDGSSEVIIADNIEWAGDLKLAQWQMLTDAKISLKGNKAELEKNGEKIVATILEPKDAAFEVISAEQAPPEMNNPGFSQLIVQRTENGLSSEIVISLGEQLHQGQRGR